MNWVSTPKPELFLPHEVWWGFFSSYIICEDRSTVHLVQVSTLHVLGEHGRLLPAFFNVSKDDWFSLRPHRAKLSLQCFVLHVLELLNFSWRVFFCLVLSVTILKAYHKLLWIIKDLNICTGVFIYFSVLAHTSGFGARPHHQMLRLLANCIKHS